VGNYCTNHDYNRAASRTAMIKAAAGKKPVVFGFDCVNLIKAILWGWSGDAKKSHGGAAYCSNGVPDTNADGMINLCSDVSTTNWADMKPGEAVWMPGHIGVYIGNGLAVECTPAWKNCVQITAVGNIGAKAGYPTRTWKKHGKMPYVEYDTVPSKGAHIDNTDYSMLMKLAASKGDIAAAAEYERKRNAKIDAMNASGQNPKGYKKTYEYNEPPLATPAKEVKVVLPKSKDNSAKNGVRFKVTVDDLNVRSSASSLTKKNIIRSVSKGTTVAWYGYYTGSFYYVQFSDKSVGYVHKKYLKKV
jgi:hypothetical protein